MPVRLTIIAAILLASAPALAAEPVAPANPEIDLSALRYYASRNETARVNAEIRRLRSLYPGWQPPADPAAIPVEAEPSAEQPLWDLFAAGRLDELKSEIAAKRAADPSFTVPKELEDKLAAKEARNTLIDASNQGDFSKVVQLAAATPGLVSPSDLDIAWRAAEAEARTGDEEAALAIHRAILDTTQEAKTRLATVQKAMAVLKPDELRKLLALGKIGPDGRSEFESIETDLLRGRIGRILAGSEADDISAAEVERVAAVARQPGSGKGDAAMLGWLHSMRKDWARAHDWFTVALSDADPAKNDAADLKSAQGDSQALRELGRSAEAEELAFRWKDRDPSLTLFYMALVEPELTRPTPIPIEEARLKRFSDVVVAQQSGSGAQALGWYAYNLGQFPAARAWFDKAMAWQPRDTTALGYALSLQQLGDKAALKAFVDGNVATYPALASINTPRGQVAAAPAAAPAAAVPRTAARASSADAAPAASGGGGGGGGSMGAAYRRKDYAGCVAQGNRMAASGRLDARAALQKGWCLMALNRPQEAAAAFGQALGNSATSGDAAYGQALALLRGGQAEQAAMAANAAPMADAKRNEIGIAVLADRAVSAFDRGRYNDTIEALDQRRMFAPEPRDLSVLRGWSLYHLGRKDDARQLFAQLDRQLSTKETKSGLAAANEPRH